MRELSFPGAAEAPRTRPACRDALAPVALSTPLAAEIFSAVRAPPTNLVLPGLYRAPPTRLTERRARHGGRQPAAAAPGSRQMRAPHRAPSQPAVAAVCRAFKDLAVAQRQPMSAMLPLLAALRKVQPSAAHLTPQHADFLQWCARHARAPREQRAPRREARMPMAEHDLDFQATGFSLP